MNINVPNPNLSYPTCKVLYAMFPKTPRTIIRDNYTYVRKQHPKPHEKKQRNGLSPKQLKIFYELMEVEISDAN